MTTPNISVLLPTFNGARYIEQQLRSILGQSFVAIDILVCDDGSSDDTVRIVESMAAAEPRIRLLESSGNLGQRARLLQLVAATDASLLAFSDQDDLWDVHKLERLEAAMNDRSMTFGPSHLIDANGNMLGITITDHIGPPPGEGDRLCYLFRPYISAHATLVRRAAVSTMAFSRSAHFDWLMSLDAAFSGGIVFVPDAVVWHRVHGENQANAAFGNARRWWTGLKPSAVYATFQRKRMRRFNFISALEHLAFSPFLNAATRRDFGRIGGLCRGAWFDPGLSRPFANPQLARLLIAVLAPHAGSERDLCEARREIARLTGIHPWNIPSNKASVP